MNCNKCNKKRAGKDGLCATCRGYRLHAGGRGPYVLCNGKRVHRDMIEPKVPREREPYNRKELRRAQRLALLPRDRRCPICKEIKLNSRRWVIKDGLVLCLTCHRETEL